MFQRLFSESSGKYPNFVRFGLGFLPALALIWSGARKELETSLTAWVGVEGYERTTTWALIPVYQNFLDLGSPLPLAAQVSNTPIAILGQWLGTGPIQQIAATVAVLIIFYGVSSSPIIPLLASWKIVLISGLVLFATHHYFTKNDWSEVFLGFLGLVLIVLILSEMSVSSFRWSPRADYLLASGIFFSVITHAGYLGASLWVVVILVAVLLSSPVFRSNFFSTASIMRFSVYCLLASALWFPTGEILIREGILSNARGVGLTTFVLDALFFGLPSIVAEAVQGEFGLFRFILFPWPALFLLGSAVKRVLRGGHMPEVSHYLSLAMALLAVLATLNVVITIPFAPSQYYFFRDGLLTLGIFAVATGRLPGSGKWNLPARTFLNLASWFGLIALVLVFFQSSAFFENMRLRALHLPSSVCKEQGSRTTFFVPLDIRRASSQDFLPAKDCSQMQIIRDNQFLVSGWLKTQQSRIDGNEEFELDNLVLEVGDEHRAWSLMGIFYIVDGEYHEDSGMPEIRELVEAGNPSASTKRCLSERCVVRVETESGTPELVIWNYHSGLVASEGSLQSTRDGMIRLLPSGPSSEVRITFNPPIRHKLSVLAGWALALSPAMSLVLGIQLKSVRKRRPHQN